VPIFKKKNYLKKLMKGFAYRERDLKGYF